MNTLKVKNPYVNYGAIPTFQKGGVAKISDEKKQELFPYFAYLYSQQLDPEKYGSIKSMKEWIELIQDNEEDIEAITKAAEKLTPEDWDSLEVQYNQAKETGAQEIASQETQYAAKGAKLKKLRALNNIEIVESYKKGGKSTKSAKSKKKKCKCGCDLILSKGTGGKIIQKCSCGCKGVK